MKGDISLSNFFIFNSSYGSNEGEVRLFNNFKIAKNLLLD